MDQMEEMALMEAMERKDKRDRKEKKDQPDLKATLEYRVHKVHMYIHTLLLTCILQYTCAYIMLHKLWHDCGCSLCCVPTEYTQDTHVNWCV